MSAPVTLYRAKNRGREGAGIPVAWRLVDDVRDWDGVSDTISADGDAWMYRVCNDSTWSAWASIDGTPWALPVPQITGYVDWFSAWEDDGVRTTWFVRALALVLPRTDTVRVVDALALAVIRHVPPTERAPHVGLCAVGAWLRDDRRHDLVRLVSDVEAYVDECERQARVAGDEARLRRALDPERSLGDPFYQRRSAARVVRSALLLLLLDEGDDGIPDIARRASDWASQASDDAASLLEVARSAIAPDVVFSRLVERERARVSSGFHEPGPLASTPARRLGR